MEFKKTQTYAILEISKRSFAEIKQRLEQSGYEHLAGKDGIDMDDIILSSSHKEKSFGDWCEEKGVVQDLNGYYNFGPSKDAALLLKMWAEDNGYFTKVFSNSSGEWCVVEESVYQDMISL